MGSSDLEVHDAEAPEHRPSGQAASPRQLARIVGVAVAGALAVVTLGLVLALWGLGLTGKISQSTSEVLDLVKLGFALVAGVGGTVGLVLAYQRHLIAVEAGQRERAKETREDAKEAREEAKLFNERFGTAAGQLASEQYAVKLAGVYAMAKLADDWDAGRQTCINVLCANLRRGYTPRPVHDTEPAELLAFRDNQDFRHTIIAVIATRLREPDSGWHQCSFDFRGAVFDGGDFNGAIFSDGTVDFSLATFSGGTVDFGCVTFSGGTVNFTSATFSGGSVNFDDAMFSGGTVDFSSASFSGGTVLFNRATFSSNYVDFSEAIFSDGTVNFSSVTVSDGTVGFIAAVFSGSTVYFGSATFSGGAVDLASATFSGGTVDFSLATFSGGTVSFSLATFSGSAVSFSLATFSDGIVDLSDVRDFSVPPPFRLSARCGARRGAAACPAGPSR